MRNRQWQIPPQPFFPNTFTKRCQSEANQAEAQAIKLFRPNTIVWASTQERNSIVVTISYRKQGLQSGSPEWTSEMLNRINSSSGKVRYHRCQCHSAVGAGHQ